MNIMCFKPPMNKSRQGVVMEAYQKLDKSGDGLITIEVRKAFTTKTWYINNKKHTLHRT